MSLDDALFLVDRGGTNYYSKGSDIADRIQVGDKVLVQRGSEHFYAWYGKTTDTDTAYYTRRVRFNNQCYSDNSGGTSAHTDQPGEVNLSYWWGCGGPSPISEFRNIRNKNVNAFVDLDGKSFPLQNNTDILEGSVCRITSDAGWSSWHKIKFQGENDGIGFKAQYTNDDDRERTDLKVEGVENTYKPANGETLTLDFFDSEKLLPFPDIQDSDLLLAWDGTKNRKVRGSNFVDLFTPVPDTCGTVRLLQTKNCPDGDDEIVISYQESHDRTVVRIKGTDWLDSGMLLEGQYVWLNNTKYKIFGLTEADCNGPSTKFFITGEVRGNEGKNGTPWHIHNCEAKLVGDWTFIPYNSSSPTIYRHMCPGESNYQKAGQAFNSTDSYIYASRIDLSGTDSYERLEIHDKSTDTNTLPWLETDRGFSRATPDNFFCELNYYNGNECALRLGRYHYTYLRDATKFVKVWDRNPRDYYMPPADFRPSTSYGGVTNTSNQNNVTDEHMWALDSNGNLWNERRYWGLFIPNGYINRQLRDSQYFPAELYDGTFNQAKWNGLSAWYGRRTYNTYNGPVDGIYVYNKTSTMENWSSNVPIEIVLLKHKEVFT